MVASSVWSYPPGQHGQQTAHNLFPVVGLPKRCDSKRTVQPQSIRHAIHFVVLFIPLCSPSLKPRFVPGTTRKLSRQSRRATVCCQARARSKAYRRVRMLVASGPVHDSPRAERMCLTYGTCAILLQVQTMEYLCPSGKAEVQQDSPASAQLLIATL